MAKLSPEMNYIIIGSVGSGELITNIENLKQLKNVYFLGPKEYSDLCRYFKYCDVAIITRRINKANEGGFPLKYFEYLSAGLPVITTDISSLSEFSEEIALGSVANTSEQFLEKIKYWLDIKKNDPSLWNNLLLKRLMIAKENSWNNRMDFLNQTLTKHL